MSLLRALLSPPVSSKQPVIRRREIFDLSEYRLNRVYYYVGNNLSIEDLTGGTIQLRFDQPDATLFTLATGQSYPLIPFNRIFLTNAISQGDTLTVEFDCYDFTHEQQLLESTTALNDLLNNIKSNPLMLLDAGTRVHAESHHANSNVVLYTVPAGRIFYLLGWSLTGGAAAAANPWTSSLYFWDGLASYDICRLETNIGGVGNQPMVLEDAGAFTSLALTFGWSIRSYASVGGITDSSIVGIEI